MRLFKIAGYLMRIKGIKILRVYGNFIEQKRFPIPNQIQPTRPIASEQECRIPKNLRRIALHYVIREAETSPYAIRLRRLENLFAKKKKKKQKVEDVLVEEYLAVRTHQYSRYLIQYVAQFPATLVCNRPNFLFMYEHFLIFLQETVHLLTFKMYRDRLPTARTE